MEKKRETLDSSRLARKYRYPKCTKAMEWKPMGWKMVISVGKLDLDLASFYFSSKGVGKSVVWGTSFPVLFPRRIALL